MMFDRRDFFTTIFGSIISSGIKFIPEEVTEIKFPYDPWAEICRLWLLPLPQLVKYKVMCHLSGNVHFWAPELLSVTRTGGQIHFNVPSIKMAKACDIVGLSLVTPEKRIIKTLYYHLNLGPGDKATFVVSLGFSNPVESDFETICRR